MTETTGPQYAAFAYQVTLTRAVITRLIAYSVLLLWMAFEIFDAAAMALHEWVHGAGMRFFGAPPTTLARRPCN